MKTTVGPGVEGLQPQEGFSPRGAISVLNSPPTRTARQLPPCLCRCDAKAGIQQSYLRASPLSSSGSETTGLTAGCLILGELLSRVGKHTHHTQ